MRPALSYDALRLVVREQQAEANKIQQEPWVERSILKKSQELLDTKWIKVVVGVRRSGKSIFSHQLLKDKKYGYINFDDERFIGLSANDLDKILQFLLECVPNIDILFFDEVQNTEGWELFVNRLQRQGYNLVITGSNSKLLSKELATHLTGRYTHIELFPFSFEEFLRAKNFEWTSPCFHKTAEKALLYSLLNEYLYKGGFPELVMEGYDADYLRELYDKIVSKDIANRYRIRFTESLREIAIYCHASLGEHVTFQKVKNLFSFNSLHTVKNHFQYLDEGYLVFLLEAFDPKYIEQSKQPRKIYTVDNGLSAAINPKFHENKRKALENLVFQELCRRKENFSHHDKTGMEVSFVVHTQKEPNSIIHVVWSLHELRTYKKIQKALVKASENLRCKNCTVITWEDEVTEELCGLSINVIPIWKWLLAIS